MRRSVTAHIECSITDPADLIWSVAVASQNTPVNETLAISVDGAPVDAVEIVDGLTRLHRTLVPAGQLVLDYRAEVEGIGAEPGVTPLDEIVFSRPSRYVDSDTLAPVAQATFAGYSGMALLESVVEFVHGQLDYVSGSSRPTDGAVHTYLARQGVCRDFAHLVIALLRALGVPARLASVYAPGLSPMDFHAVAEALVDGHWQLVDATRLAPRTAMLRIATGRDASDTAFLTTLSGTATLDAMEVTAITTGDLPLDDPTKLTQLR